MICRLTILLTLLIAFLGQNSGCRAESAASYADIYLDVGEELLIFDAGEGKVLAQGLDEDDATVTLTLNGGTPIVMPVFEVFDDPDWVPNGEFWAWGNGTSQRWCAVKIPLASRVHPVTSVHVTAPEGLLTINGSAADAVDTDLAAGKIGYESIPAVDPSTVTARLNHKVGYGFQPQNRAPQGMYLSNLMGNTSGWAFVSGGSGTIDDNALGLPATLAAGQSADKYFAYDFDGLGYGATDTLHIVWDDPTVSMRLRSGDGTTSAVETVNGKQHVECTLNTFTKHAKVQVTGDCSNITEFFVCFGPDYDPATASLKSPLAQWALAALDGVKIVRTMDLANAMSARAPQVEHIGEFNANHGLHIVRQSFAIESIELADGDFTTGGGELTNPVPGYTALKVTLAEDHGLLTGFPPMGGGGDPDWEIVGTDGHTGAGDLASHDSHAWRNNYPLYVPEGATDYFYLFCKFPVSSGEGDPDDGHVDSTTGTLKIKWVYGAAPEWHAIIANNAPDCDTLHLNMHFPQTQERRLEYYNRLNAVLDEDIDLLIEAGNEIWNNGPAWGWQRRYVENFYVVTPGASNIHDMIAQQIKAAYDDAVTVFGAGRVRAYITWQTSATGGFTNIANALEGQGFDVTRETAAAGGTNYLLTSSGVRRGSGSQSPLLLYGDLSVESMCLFHYWEATSNIEGGAWDNLADTIESLGIDCISYEGGDHWTTSTRGDRQTGVEFVVGVKLHMLPFHSRFGKVYAFAMDWAAQRGVAWQQFTLNGGIEQAASNYRSYTWAAFPFYGMDSGLGDGSDSKTDNDALIEDYFAGVTFGDANEDGAEDKDGFVDGQDGHATWEEVVSTAVSPRGYWINRYANVATSGAPLAYSRPTITGYPQGGRVLTRTAGSYDDQRQGALTIAAKWWRADTPPTQATDTHGANAVEIAGATGAAYTATSADIGKYVYSSEVPSNDAGAGPAFLSNALGPVEAPVEGRNGFVTSADLVHATKVSLVGEEYIAENTSVLYEYPVSTAGAAGFGDLLWGTAWEFTTTGRGYMRLETGTGGVGRVPWASEPGFTIACVFQPSTVSGSSRMLLRSAGNAEIYVRLNGSTLESRISTTASGLVNQSISGLVAGKTYIVVLKFDETAGGGTATLRLKNLTDGAAWQTNASAGGHGAVSSEGGWYGLSVGATNDSGNNQFLGKILDPYIWTRATTTAEDDQMAAGPEPINTAPPAITTSGPIAVGADIAFTTGTWDDNNNGTGTQQVDILRNGSVYASDVSSPYTTDAAGTYKVQVQRTNDGGPSSYIESGNSITVSSGTVTAPEITTDRTSTLSGADLKN